MTTPVDPTFEMMIGGVWTDITADCNLDSADSGGGARIRRGRSNESPAVEPTELEFVLNNRDGKYSPKNPLSEYFGLIGRNTPVRVGVYPRNDAFSRTIADGWGSFDRTVVDNWGNVFIERTESWSITGTADGFDVTPGAATVQASSTVTRVAGFGRYADVDVHSKMKISTRDSDWGQVVRHKDLRPSNMADGTFENGKADWNSPYNSTFEVSSVRAYDGSYSALFTKGAAADQAYVRPIDSKAAVVVDGQLLRLRMYVYSPTGGDIYIGMDFYTSAFGYVTTRGTTVTVPPGVWTLAETSQTVPSDPGIEYVGYGPTLPTALAAGFELWVDNIELQVDLANREWYSIAIVPGATDRIRIQKITQTVTHSWSEDLPTNFVAGTWYHMRTQVHKQRIRSRFWADGSDEPTTWSIETWDQYLTEHDSTPADIGHVGIYAVNGTGLLTVESFDAVQWRAHAEIAKLPPRWDLSRTDRWVPIQAAGILQRLGQGRKSVESAVHRHLSQYDVPLWLPLEDEPDPEYAGTPVPGGYTGRISGLSFAADDDLPGVRGVATLSEDTSSIFADGINYTPGSPAAWTFMMFMRIPNLPASNILLANIRSTGTARTWQLTLQTDGVVKIDAYNSSGTIISTDTAWVWGFTEHPVGSWIAMSLYLYQNGANVTWAFNYHRPGGATGFLTSGDNSFAGSVGLGRAVHIRSSSAHTAAGNLQVAHVLIYPGDLPFVTDAFSNAASAHVGETTRERYVRLCAELGIRAGVMGAETPVKTMGPQLPKKPVELLEETAEVEDGILMEERAEPNTLCLRLLNSLYNQRTLELDIDSGHLTSPLIPSEDDQGSRNDVTVTRTLGGVGRSVQLTGPMNVNPPESDVDGIGVYDEQVEINLGTLEQITPMANFRRSRGTLVDPRYPSMHADLTAEVYQDDPALLVAALSVDTGDITTITNVEISPDPIEQFVQSYTEHFDLYDYDITWTGTPGTLYRVGAVGITTRMDTSYSVTEDLFTSGTDTALWVQRTDTEKALWVLPADSPQSFPFDIMVSGVRLRVTSISGGSDPQQMTVEQTPINGIEKAIPLNSPVRLAEPWRLAR